MEKTHNVLITGACGGMGSAVTKTLQNNGYQVFAFDKKIINPILGVNYYEGDITNNDDIKKAFQDISHRITKLDAIINFAGIYNLDSLVEIDEEELIRIFNINVFGVYRINKIFMPLLQKNSKIIITSSELAPLAPLPFTGLYAITKSTLEKYAYSLRMELGLLNIKVILVRPGAVKTDLLTTSTTALDHFCNKTTFYNCNAKKFRQIVNNVEAKTISPSQIGKIVLKIMSCKHPKYVYNINRNKMLRLLNFLPQKVQVAVIKKIIK